jgi:vancomycin aglycone glucosyltransferase
MRVLLTTYGGRGDVEPLVGLAVRLRTFGAEVRMCAPEACAERLAEVGVLLVPAGQPACCKDPWCADNARHEPGP